MRTIVTLHVEHAEPASERFFDSWKVDLLETLHRVLKQNINQFTKVIVEEIHVKLAKNRHAILYDALILTKEEMQWYSCGVYLTEVEARKAALYKYKQRTDAVEWKIEPIVVKERFEE
jgi:hypothetical protein